jgi:hypothetical protein
MQGWAADARSASICVSMSLIRRVRAAHGHVAWPKYTSYTYSLVSTIRDLLLHFIFYFSVQE